MLFFGVTPSTKRRESIDRKNVWYYHHRFGQSYTENGQFSGKETCGLFWSTSQTATSDSPTSCQTKARTVLVKRRDTFHSIAFCWKPTPPTSYLVAFQKYVVC